MYLTYLIVKLHKYSRKGMAGDQCDKESIELVRPIDIHPDKRGAMMGN